MGFKVFSHVQLNLSWGNIISDIDLIAIGEDVILGVEVKSNKDNLQKASKQIDRMMDLFDGIYIASDKLGFLESKKISDPRVGLLLVGKEITVKKDCYQLIDKPRNSTLLRLRKLCLQRLT
jgi:hypothetical protein